MVDSELGAGYTASMRDFSPDSRMSLEQPGRSLPPYGRVLFPAAHYRRDLPFEAAAAFVRSWEAPLDALAERAMHKRLWSELFFPLSCYQFDAPLALVVLDTAVVHGRRRAARLLQETLGVTVDGVIGQTTCDAVHMLCGRTLARALIETRQWHCLELVRRCKRMADRLPEWLTRIERLRAECHRWS